MEDQTMNDLLLTCNELSVDHPPPLKRKCDCTIDTNGYVLRENPKKSWKFCNILCENNSPQEKPYHCAKECDSASGINGVHFSKENKNLNCHICGNPFKSVRALNTHMRTHSWPSFINSVEPIELVRKKRSERRRCHVSNPPVIEETTSEFDEEEREVAQILLTFSAAVASQERCVLKNDEQEDEVKSAVSCDTLKFKCKICNRKFASYQKLGGHQTLHRLNKDFNTVRNKCNDFPLETKENYGLTVHGKEFECKVCKKIFASGKALGGHKKAHVEKAKEYVGDFVDYVVDKNSEVNSLSLWFLRRRDCAGFGAM